MINDEILETSKSNTSKTAVQISFDTPNLLIIHSHWSVSSDDVQSKIKWITVGEDQTRRVDGDYALLMKARRVFHINPKQNRHMHCCLIQSRLPKRTQESWRRHHLTHPKSPHSFPLTSFKLWWTTQDKVKTVKHIADMNQESWKNSNHLLKELQIQGCQHEVLSDTI